jgi:hypothetical protein
MLGCQDQLQGAPEGVPEDPGGDEGLLSLRATMRPCDCEIDYLKYELYLYKFGHRGSMNAPRTCVSEVKTYTISIPTSPCPETNSR